MRHYDTAKLLWESYKLVILTILVVLVLNILLQFWDKKILDVRETSFPAQELKIFVWKEKSTTMMKIQKTVSFSPDIQSSINWRREEEKKKSQSKLRRTFNLQIHRGLGREENFPTFSHTVTIGNIFQMSSVSSLCHMLRSAKILYFGTKRTILFRGFEITPSAHSAQVARQSHFIWKNLAENIFQASYSNRNTKRKRCKRHERNQSEIGSLQKFRHDKK